MKERIKNMVEKWIVDKQNKDEHRRAVANNVFYASQAGGCPRALYYKKVFGDKEFEVRALLIFQMGNIVHDFLQKEILKGESEKSLTIQEDGVVIYGRLDHIDDEEVIEIKSTGAVKYNEKEASPHHLEQLNLYMKAMGREKGRMVYVEKNTLEIVEHEVKFNPELYQKTVDNFRQVAKAVEIQVAPAKLSDYPKSWKCRYCDYKDECKTDKKPNEKLTDFVPEGSPDPQNEVKE